MKTKVTLMALVMLIALTTASGRAVPAGAESAGQIIAVNQGGDGHDAFPGDGVCETYPGYGLCTLRAAVMEANALPGADTILLPEMTVTLTYPANPPEEAAHNGDLNLTDDVTIMGAGENKTILDGNWAVTHGRVMTIQAGVTATVRSLSIRNGSNELGPGIAGGLLNLGTLTLEHVSFSNNEFAGFTNSGTATLNHTTFTDHDSYYSAVVNDEGSLTILNSTIADNFVDGKGGGLWSSLGTLTLINSTVSNNRAAYAGGGITAIDTRLTILNSTISGNWAEEHGGGLYLLSVEDGPGTRAYLDNVTVANNVANVSGLTSGLGGGLYVLTASWAGPVSVNMRNSLLANNRRLFIFGAADDCHGNIISGGYNLVRTTAGCNLVGDTTGNLTGQDPVLDLLADYGGATETHALKPGSPAIGAGNPAGCDDGLGAPLTTDQRGFLRPTAGRCDIGAYEYQAGLPQVIFVPFIGR